MAQADECMVMPIIKMTNIEKEKNWSGYQDRELLWK